MNIVDKFHNGRQGVIYTVELDPNYLVDVAVSYETGLIYTMEHSNGSTVYGASGHKDTYPNYEYDKDRVIAWVTELEKYIFEDDLMTDDQFECINGYLWATDNLIDRFCQQKGEELGVDIVDDINFYAIYHISEQEIEIAGTYWVSFEKNITEEQKSFTLTLSSEDEETLIAAMNSYCKQRYRKNCFEFINAIRAEEKLPLLDGTTTNNPSLSHQIRSAASKAMPSDSLKSNPNHLIR